MMEMERSRPKPKSLVNSSFSIDRLLNIDDRENAHKTGLVVGSERGIQQETAKVPRPIYHRSSLPSSEKLYRHSQNARTYRELPSPLERYSAPETSFDCRLLHPSCYRPAILPSYHQVGNICLHRPSPCFASPPSAFISPVGTGLSVSGTYLGCPDAVAYKDKDCISAVDFSCRRPSFEDKDESRRKGGQIRFSHVQSMELERVFSHQKYISPQERKQLARALQLSERQVKTWFQNRRAKWRRIRMEAEMRQRMARDSRLREHDNEATDEDEQYYDKGHDTTLSPSSDGKCDMTSLE